MCSSLRIPTILPQKYLKNPHGEVDFGKFFVWDPMDNNYTCIISSMLLTLVFIDVRQKKNVIFLLITFAFEDYEQSLEEKQS